MRRKSTHVEPQNLRIVIMRKRFLIYLFILFLLSFLTVFYVEYSFLLMLIIAVAVPLISWILAFIQSRIIQLEIFPERPYIELSEKPTYAFHKSGVFRILQNGLRYDIRVKNSALGGVVHKYRKVRFAGGEFSGKKLMTTLSATHVCAIELTVMRLHIIDLLSLFDFRKKTNMHAGVVVLPPLKNCPDGLLIYTDGADDAARAQFGVVGDDYELRDYRPGDRMNRVHRVLSVKEDKLIIRNPLPESSGICSLVADFSSIHTPKDRDVLFTALYSCISRIVHENSDCIVLIPADHATVSRHPISRASAVDPSALRDSIFKVLTDAIHTEADYPDEQDPLDIDAFPLEQVAYLVTNTPDIYLKSEHKNQHLAVIDTASWNLR